MASQPAAATGPLSLPGLAPSSERTIDRRSPSYWAQAHASAHDDPRFPLDLRLELVRQHGSFSMAYSTAIQPHLQYFGDERGYIAYRSRWGLTFVLGDPVCSAERRPALLREFISAHRRPTFVQISYDTAQQLSQLGCLVNEVGVDTRLDLDQYDFKGKEKEWLRYSENWILRRNFRISEGSLKANEHEVVALSDSWRATRRVKRKEVRVLNRPLVIDDEPHVRPCFLFDEAGKMNAFVFFDPVFAGGEVVGYVTCFKRRLPETSQYAEPAIMKAAIEQFKKEGIRHVWLGLSPLANVEDKELRHNRFLHWTVRYLHSAGWLNKYFYNFVGHTQYKSRFRGVEEKTYYATPSRFNSHRLLALASLCGII